MPHRARKAHRLSAKSEAPSRQGAKPQAPLIIAISINKQTMKIYDANGLFAETPISTGMRGHSTPMGAFSVIQKQKLHHSNIYSGAPMPYMQRITWSGIAIHAGVLPGYPASHGCIRMPMAFADQDVRLDPDGCAGHRHARRDHSGQFFASAARRAKGLPQAGCGSGAEGRHALTATSLRDDGRTRAKPTILQARLELQIDRRTSGHLQSPIDPSTRYRHPHRRASRRALPMQATSVRFESDPRAMSGCNTRVRTMRHHGVSRRHRATLTDRRGNLHSRRLRPNRSEATVAGETRPARPPAASIRAPRNWQKIRTAWPTRTKQRRRRQS